MVKPQSSPSNKTGLIHFKIIQHTTWIPLFVENFLKVMGLVSREYKSNK